MSINYNKRVEPIDDWFGDMMKEYRERNKMEQYWKRKKEGRKAESDFNGYLREASLRYKNHSGGCRYTSNKKR